MSYHIYTTDGIILKRTAFGEADILLHILTADFGLIMASARSARLSVSKLRGALQEYAYISVSCIKGKNGWKVTNVVDEGSFYFEYPEYCHKVLAQISFVLLKMIQGETPHPEIFQTVRSGFEFLKNVTEKDISNFEILSVLRILHQLGYVAKDSNTEIFFENIAEWNNSLLEKIAENKNSLVGLINKALKESHM